MTDVRHPKNAPGPFYVAADCCTFCGVPQATAPSLFDEDDDSCFVTRQPATPAEVDRMLLTMMRAELSCIRYAGTNGDIVRRLAEQGGGALADVPAQRPVRPVLRDHAALRRLKIEADPKSLMQAFVAHLGRQPMPERYRFEINDRGPDRCDLRVAWVEDNFHVVSFQRATAPEFDWLIVGLPFLIADWLADDAIAGSVFFERSDWFGDRVAGTNVPW
jgi:hypothetical protein